VILKEDLFKTNEIDPLLYTSEKIYKIIKKQKIPYNSLSKDSIVHLIMNHNGQVNPKKDVSDEVCLESNFILKL
jgi:hypothetical protein